MDEELPNFKRKEAKERKNYYARLEEYLNNHNSSNIGSRMFQPMSVDKKYQNI